MAGGRGEVTAAEDRAWIGGRIRTEGRRVEAMLVEGGRVVALGSDEEIRRARPTGCVTTALRGRAVVPGLVDSHLHIMSSALRITGVDLSGVRSTTEFTRRLRAASVRRRRGPIVGGGWDQERIRGHGWPNRGLLDRVVDDRPVALSRVCGHVAVLNSRALEALGIDRGTPDPPGGRIGRERDGEPDGLLFDNALRAVVDLQAESFGHLGPEIRRMFRRWNSFGLTRVGDLGISPEALGHLEALDRARPLSIGIHAYLRLERWEARMRPSPPGGGRRIRTVGVKAVLDGALGARTAWLKEPYHDAPGERGLSLWPRALLEERLAEARQRGFSPALHAIGDRALARAIAVIGALPPGPRARIEHASLLTPGLLRSLRKHRTNVVVQPAFRWSDRWINERLGVPRARWSYAFRSLLDAGVPLAGSSDAPVESVDPWTGMRAAVSTPPWARRGEQITPQEALDLYTSGASAALLAPEAGRLAVGGPADFVVLRTDSVEAAVARSAAVVASCWRAGRRVGGAC